MIEFAQALADTYINKYVLIGITYLDPDGKLLRQEQMHGTIESASTNGILISFQGTRVGSSWNMPPMLSAIRKADPGSYRLKSTGEIIENPDYLITWINQSGNRANNAMRNDSAHPIASDYDPNKWEHYEE